MAHESHEGPCQLGLGFISTQPEHTAATYLERAIDWSRGLEEFDAERPLAEAVLARWRAEDRGNLNRLTVTPRELHLAVTREEFEAVTEIVREARDYWITNEYGADPDCEEDQWLVNDRSAGEAMLSCGLFYLRGAPAGST